MTSSTRLAELKARREEVETEIVRLANKGETEFGPGHEEHWSRKLKQRDKLTAEIVALEERQDAHAEFVRDMEEKRAKGLIREIPGAHGPGFSPDFGRLGDIDDPTRSAAMRLVDSRRELAPHQQDRLDTLIRADRGFADSVNVLGTRTYESAFAKLLAVGDPGIAATILTDAERDALSTAHQYRAQSLTSGSGGLAVPVFIDPTVILTDQENSNPFLSICTVHDITTSTWKGVASAGMSWGFYEEATETADDSLTSITQPSIDAEMARGFVPYSIEIGEDWPGFAQEMSRLLAEGYNELLVEKFTTGAGSGSHEPMGVLTAADASTGVEVVTTTDGQFGAEDLYKVWNALPAKHRRNASWLMSTSVNNKIRQFGAYDASHAHTVNLPAGAANVLFGRPVFDDPYMPDYSSTTGKANLCIVGDFRKWVIVRRTGLSVELVPHLLHTGANRPSGSRGVFAYARIGAGAGDLGAVRLLQNQ